jgi:hypothetical protein
MIQITMIEGLCIKRKKNGIFWFFETEQIDFGHF